MKIGFSIVFRVKIFALKMTNGLKLDEKERLRVIKILFWLFKTKGGQIEYNTDRVVTISTNTLTGLSSEISIHIGYLKFPRGLNTTSKMSEGNDQVALSTDPIDVVIDKLLRYVFTRVQNEKSGRRMNWHSLMFHCSLPPALSLFGTSIA